MSRVCGLLLECVFLSIATVSTTPPQALLSRQPTSKPLFTIAVIAGEDAVNIISQKTAVAPIVEVRDRNKLPIAGASVVFWISTGNAAFSEGAKQLTVITDAAGRAVGTGYAPTSAGPVNIDVVVTVDGQTSTTSISQSNMMTAGQPTRPEREQSDAKETDGGWGARTWLTVVGGAVAGTAAITAATRAPDCRIDVVPPSDLSQVPGTTNIQRFVLAIDPPDCEPSNWSATSPDSFVTLSPSAGSGSAIISASFATNNPSAPTRNFSVTIAGILFTGTQRQNLPPCNSQQIAGGNAPETRSVEMGVRSGTFVFSYDTQQIPDRMVVSHAGQTLFDTGCVGTNGTRSQTLSYSGTTTSVSVAVTPNCLRAGSTAWSFTVSCPR